MEKRDLYDKNKNLVGKTIYKDEKIPEGYYIMVVLTMIRNSKGEYLIQKRSQEKDGMYGATGGHPKTGETGLEGAITEIKEEIGLDVDKSEMKLLFEERVDKEQVFFELYFLERDFEIEELTLQKEEVEFAEWMTLEKIENIIQSGKFKKNHIEEVYRTVDIVGK